MGCRENIRIELQKKKNKISSTGMVNNSIHQTIQDSYFRMDYIENESSTADNDVVDTNIGISDYQTFPMNLDSEVFQWQAISTRNFTNKNEKTEKIVFDDLIG